MNRPKTDRICSACGLPMAAVSVTEYGGFIVFGGEEYYCSEYTPDEWEEMHSDDSMDCYWTTWEYSQDNALPLASEK